MRQPTRHRSTLLAFVLIALLFAVACNLTTTPPTPTARPELPATVTRAGAPTLFASITPLIGGGSSGGGVIVTSVPPANCPPPSGWVAYQIEAGDSLSGLADASGTTLQALVQANCLADPDTLYTGQTIYLPRSPISG